MNKKDLIVLIFVGIVLLLVYLFSQELTHQIIFSYAGVNSKIEFGLFGGKTTPTSEITSDLSNLMLAQALTESIGYQITPFLILIIFFQLISLIKSKT